MLLTFYFLSTLSPLKLCSTALREIEFDTTASQSPVNLAICVQAVVNTTSLLLVQDDLENFRAVLLCSQTLADDLNRVDNVGEDCLVDSGESAGSGPLLGLGSAGAGGALGARQDATGSED